MANEVRIATPADVAALHSLQGKPWSRDAGYVWREALRQRAERGDIVAAIIDDQPAGYILLARRRDLICHISQCIVHEDLWRNGVGAAMMATAIREGLKGACNSLTVKCAADAPATRFWPAIGMRHIGDVMGQRRLLHAWSAPIGPNGALRMPPPARRHNNCWKRQE